MMEFTTIAMTQENKVFFRNIIVFPDYIKSDNSRIEYLKEYLRKGGVISYK